MEFKTYVGGRIRAIRLSRNLTQVELAKKMKISPGAISQIETGRVCPNSTTLFLFCLHLNTSPVVLLPKFKQFQGLKKYSITRKLSKHG